MACGQLQDQDFDVYLPTYPKSFRRCDNHFTEMSHLFPRYLFVRPFREEQCMASVRSTLGVQQLVCFGAELADVTESMVADIRAMEADLRGDLERLPFKAGDEIEITERPFASITAKVFACAENRMLLLFEFLGSKQKLDVHSDQCRLI